MSNAPKSTSVPCTERRTERRLIGVTQRRRSARLCLGPSAGSVRTPGIPATRSCASSVRLRPSGPYLPTGGTLVFADDDRGYIGAMNLFEWEVHRSRRPRLCKCAWGLMPSCCEPDPVALVAARANSRRSKPPARSPSQPPRLGMFRSISDRERLCTEPYRRSVGELARELTPADVTQTQLARLG
jgi:hypothetical protein